MNLCKHCGELIGYRNRGYGFLVQKTYDKMLGDHEEREIHDAAALCSWKCVRDYAEAQAVREGAHEAAIRAKAGLA